MTSLRLRLGRIAVLPLALLFPEWNATAGEPGTDPIRPMRGELPSGEPIAFLGNGSCSSSACHGRGVARGVHELDPLEPRIGWEHLAWSRFDPHARAFSTLQEEESRRIVRNLRRIPAHEIARPERDGLCLSCHVQQNIAGATHAQGFAVSDGIGCESCHGAASGWIAEHFRPAWSTLSEAERADLGFVPLGSLPMRARACTPCHVGSHEDDPTLGLVDVNHDLIAAGHPRLNFEFASYYARYPKHWSDLAERRSDPAFEARAWMVGQLATAEASLRVLKARATRSVEADGEDLPPALGVPGTFGRHAGPWPEFAEYNCFACHHDLRGGVRAGSVGLGGVPGDFAWGTWAMPMTELIAGSVPPARGDWPGSLRSLERVMRAPRPEVSRVVPLVEGSLRLIEDWMRDVDEAPLGPSELGPLSMLVSSELAEADGMTWDRHAQLYLAYVALLANDQGSGGAGDEHEARRFLDSHLGRLRYPVGMGSPGREPEIGPDEFLVEPGDAP